MVVTPLLSSGDAPAVATLPCFLAVGAPVSYRHALCLLRETQFVQGNPRSHWGC
jgi:hypothetical protein